MKKSLKIFISLLIGICLFNINSCAQEFAFVPDPEEKIVRTRGNCRD